MTDRDYSELCDALVGAWVGQRDSSDLKGEKVRSIWRETLGGSFLHEDWYTSGKEGILLHTATAFFKIGSAAPGDFFVAYKDGAIALGDSTFDANIWVLSHRWLRSAGTSRMTLQLLSDNTYQQDVFDLDGEGASTLISRAVLVRD